jgi:cystathionine beta-lyase/cystathionine gamma-synthase
VDDSARAFEEAMAELEGAEAAVASASGMAAITGVVLALCSGGDHVVVPHQVFLVTKSLFGVHCPRFGIDVTFVDGTDPAHFAAAVRPGATRLVFVETPANPTLSLTDIEAVASIPGPCTVVDSTFAPPVLQQPLARGADLVLHAATKGLAGHNDALLGVVSGRRDLIDTVAAWHGAHGGQAAPFDAWNGWQGLRTLSVRTAQQCATAQFLAERLEAHPAIATVHYPGLDSHPQRDLAKRQMSAGGTLLAVELAGGRDAARRFCSATRLARVALSLGGPETILTHPASITAGRTPEARRALGITDGLVRISVGLEHAGDLAADLDRALAVATAAPSTARRRSPKDVHHP